MFDHLANYHKNEEQLSNMFSNQHNCSKKMPKKIRVLTNHLADDSFSPQFRCGRQHFDIFRSKCARVSWQILAFQSLNLIKRLYAREWQFNWFSLFYNNKTFFRTFAQHSPFCPNNLTKKRKFDGTLRQNSNFTVLC